MGKNLIIMAFSWDRIQLTCEKDSFFVTISQNDIVQLCIVVQDQHILILVSGVKWPQNSVTNVANLTISNYRNSTKMPVEKHEITWKYMKSLSFDTGGSRTSTIFW